MTAPLSSRTARRASGLALVLAAGLGMSACGTIGEAGAAATVDGRRIPVSDVESATKDTLCLVRQGGSLDQRQVLGWLITAPYMERAAATLHVGVSDADVLRVWAQTNPKSQPSCPATPSAPAVAAIRSAFSRQALDPSQGSLDSAKVLAAFQQMSKDLTAADVKVSPRYGTFDPNFNAQTGAGLSVTATSPDWIKSTPSPSASPSPAAS